MIILKLLAWMIMGFITIYATVLIHFIVAERGEYDPGEWWSKHTPELLGEMNYIWLRFIFGLIIWPIRVIQFCMSIPWLYEQYELK